MGKTIDKLKNIKIVKTLSNIGKIEDLRTRLLITLMFVAVYRFGSYIVLPGVDTNALQGLHNQTEGGPQNVIRRIVVSEVEDEEMGVEDQLRPRGHSAEKTHVIPHRNDADISSVSEAPDHESPFIQSPYEGLHLRIVEDKHPGPVADTPLFHKPSQPYRCRNVPVEDLSILGFGRKRYVYRCKRSG